MFALSPGTYEHEVTKNRKIKFHGTFGGPQTLKGSITIVCHNGEPDIVSYYALMYGTFMKLLLFYDWINVHLLAKSLCCIRNF